MSSGEHAPIFGSWPRAYIFALTLFAIEVALLYAFTVRFS